MSAADGVADRVTVDDVLTSPEGAADRDAVGDAVLAAEGAADGEARGDGVVVALSVGREVATPSAVTVVHCVASTLERPLVLPVGDAADDAVCVTGAEPLARDASADADTNGDADASVGATLPETVAEEPPECEAAPVPEPDDSCDAVLRGENDPPTGAPAVAEPLALPAPA